MTASTPGAARRIYSSLKQSPVGRVLNTGPIQSVRSRLLAWRPDDVVKLMRELDRRGVQAWLGGGWGIDALMGRKTRTHGDVDLFVVGDDTALRDALQAMGFSVHVERFARGKLVRNAIARSRQGRVIDIVTTLDPALLIGDRAHTTGRIDGAAVPCLSADLQLTLHTGYAPERSDRRDIAQLCHAFAFDLPPEYRDDAGGRASALVVPVPEAEHLLARAASQTRRRWPGGGGTRPLDSGTHITLLHPFVPSGRIDGDLERNLGDLFRAHPSFGFRLARTGRFPDVLYVAPDPGKPFVALTAAIHDRWPEYPPYGGLHDDIVPHLTVAFGATGSGLESAVERELPIESYAREVWLLLEDRAGWYVRARFPLGQEQQP